MSASPRPIPMGLVVNRSARAVQRCFRRGDLFWRGQVPDDLVRCTHNLEELEEAIVALRDRGVGALAVFGGDGSVHHFVDAVLRHFPEGNAPIVLALAGGTMNGVSRALGSGGAPARVLQSAAQALDGGAPRVRARYVLRVTDPGDGQVRHGFGLATGIVYRAYEHYYRRSEPGILDAVSASLLPVRSALFGGAFFRGVQLDVRGDGARWMSEPPHTLVASVLDAPLLWFRPFGAPLGDAAAFHLAATAMRPREIVPRLWSLFRGRCRHPRVKVDRVRNATVRVTGDVGYIIDGDLYRGHGPVELELTVGPRLRFLVPATVRPAKRRLPDVAPATAR